MALSRNEKTGRFESSNPDIMSKLMVEHKMNSKGQRLMRRFLQIHEESQG